MPFAVGTVDRVMLDLARTNLYRYSPRTNTFMVTFWYPPDPPPAGALPASMWDKRLATDSGIYTYISVDTRWTKICSAAVAHRFAGIPVTARPGKYPVVLYSHGGPEFRKLDSQKAEELASHGYVVVAADHADCWGTAFPDGRYLPGVNRGIYPGDVSGRLQDLQFLHEQCLLLRGAMALQQGGH